MSRKKLKIIDLCPSDFPLNSLPTNQNVIQTIYFEKKSEGETFKAAIKKVATKLVEIWNRASLPTVQYKTITDKIQSYHKNYLKLAYTESRYKSYKAKDRNY